MSYVDENLLPDEHVIYRAHLHWAIYLPAAYIVLIGLLFTTSSNTADFGGLVIVIGAITAVFAWIRVTTSEFAVTDKRVVIKTGLIRRRSLELLLRQVETIGVEQGIVGRMLGYGAIAVGGTGGTKEPFKTISSPLEFRRQVQIQSTTTDTRGSPAQVPTGPEKVCPRCAETVKAAAKVCRYCNHEFA